MSDTIQLSPRRQRRKDGMEKAREWRREGYTLREISKALGYSAVTVMKWVKDLPKGDIFADPE